MFIFLRENNIWSLRVRRYTIQIVKSSCLILTVFFEDALLIPTTITFAIWHQVNYTLLYYFELKFGVSALGAEGSGVHTLNVAINAITVKIDNLALMVDSKEAIFAIHFYWA